ncbi:hypothetical protein GCM10009830_39790 [Glycomyces endophyticus]|uniref:Uncharacterized protein n=1 Tax=Glycomyces endophyticus TaxID=480996 RepID=A0ABN2HIG3_9ACTN
MRAPFARALRTALLLGALIAVTGLHRRSGGDSGDSPDTTTGGPSRARVSATQPPVGAAIRNNTAAVHDHRPVHQIGLGRHVTNLKPGNSATMRNPNPTTRPYGGGWHSNHSNLKANGLESNHVPPQQIMSKLNPPWTYSDGKPWTKGHASAIELDYEDHRVVSTTGSGADPAHLKKLEDVLNDPTKSREDRMAEALLLEHTDMQSKLAYHNTQMMVQPDYSPNPHNRPLKDPTRYDEAYRDMIRTCYPELRNHPKLTNALGPI